MTDAARIGPSRALAVALVGLLCLIWGSTWLVIRASLEDLPPFTSAATRFAVAAALMFPVCAALARREGGARPPLGLVAATGTLQFAGSYGIVYWAEQTLPSALTSVLWAVFPICMAIAAHVGIPGERLRPAQAAGFLLGFVGVVVLFATEVDAVGGDASTRALVLLLSPVVVAISTVLIKRHVGVSSLLLNRDAMVLGAAELWLLAWLVEDPAQVAWTREAAFAVGYLAAIGTVLTFSVYLWLLRYAPANRLSVIPYVSPVVALALGATIGDEPIGATAPLGLVLILFGVVLVTAAPRRARRIGVGRSEG